MFSSNMSQANKDYLTFLDGGSKVPYYVNDTKYSFMPVNIKEQIELDNKIYIHAHSGYFVGIRTSKFVRSISAQDYRLIQSEINKLEIKNELVIKVQLVMEFC